MKRREAGKTPSLFLPVRSDCFFARAGCLLYPPLMSPALPSIIRVSLQVRYLVGVLQVRPVEKNRFSTGRLPQN